MILKDTEKFKVINEVGKEAHKEKRTQSHEIAWHTYKPEEREGKTALDGLHAYTNKKEQKKALKAEKKKEKETQKSTKKWE